MAELGMIIVGKNDTDILMSWVLTCSKKIVGKWMFIPLKMVLIGIDPYPYGDLRKTMDGLG